MWKYLQNPLKVPNFSHKLMSQFPISKLNKLPLSWGFNIIQTMIAFSHTTVLEALRKLFVYMGTERRFLLLESSICDYREHVSVEVVGTCNHWSATIVVAVKDGC